MVGDAVSVAVAGEHHVARVHDGGAAVVGDLGLALQDVVNLRILDVRMLLDAAPGRQGDDVEHGGAFEHFRRREDDVLTDTAFNVAAVFHGFDSNVLFVFDHWGDILGVFEIERKDTQIQVSESNCDILQLFGVPEFDILQKYPFIHHITI